MDDAKKGRRLETLGLAGVQAAQFVTTYAKKKFEVPVGLRYAPEAGGPALFLNVYLDRLADFKSRNSINDLIDTPKIAAISTGILMEMETDQFFADWDPLKGTMFEKTIMATFAYRLTCGLLRVNYDAVPQPMRNYFYSCFCSNKRADPEWLAWGKTAFCIKWGILTDEPKD